MFTKDTIIVFVIIILALWVLYPIFEGFDASGREFVPVGALRYGLRGEPLRAESIRKNFIRPDRQIRLSESNSEMWESNDSPGSEGMKGCRKVKCPQNDGYDNTDTCWKCGKNCLDPIRIPDIWPHVKN